MELMKLNDYLEVVASRMRDIGLACSAVADVAGPASAIARLADSADVPAIVMATHGRTGLARAVMGSVAGGVLARAHVPVLVVRPASLLLAPKTDAMSMIVG